MSNDKYISDYIPAPIAKNENQRLEAVKRTGAMYLDQDELYDVYCYLAKEITGCPVSWTGLIDSENQYCLASDGFPEDTSKKIPRKQTFCQYALDKTEPLIIQNMKSDLTFKKLNFKARRGMKETTEILKRIFAEYQTLSRVQKEELEDLLNLNDQEIFDLIFKQRDAFENKFSSLKNFLYE